MPWILSIVLTVIGISGLFAVGSRLKTYSYISMQLRYQPITLVLALGLFAIAYHVSGTPSLLTFGQTSALGQRMEIFGYPSNASWSSIGPQFAAVAFVVTSLVVYLQVLKGKSHRGLVMAVAISIPFSVTNALTEEIIFRATPLQVLANADQPLFMALLSAALFGIPHYFGTPGKLPGVLMAGFLGFIAALSVIGTQGLAIAWLIHFVQDVPIIAMMILASRNT